MINTYVEASAPGRMDVMGGIADYSGSLVLQMPIAQHATIQLTLREDYQCHLQSTISTGEVFSAHVDYRHYMKDGEVDYAFAQDKFKQDPATHWISYVIGCALVLQKEKGIFFTGADFQIISDVPLGKGVSSSASVEVATMKALAIAFNLPLNGTLLPVLAQRVENLVVGAPCGLMDQLASYFGEHNKLLPILCQPDKIEPPIALAEGISFVGIDSGIRHSISGASYSDVRCATFMGYTVLTKAMGISIDELASAKAKLNFDALPFKGFLCNIPVQKFEEELLPHLPDSISGKDFIHEYGLSIDLVTVIDEKKYYQVKQCTSHPIHEHSRVQRFKEYLLALHSVKDEKAKVNMLINMGNLMYQSHESYSLCGLGSDRTDEIVALSRTASGIYGAKITGGGNGGSVCLLVDAEGKKSARQIHQFLCEKYQEELVFFES